MDGNLIIENTLERFIMVSQTYISRIESLDKQLLWQCAKCLANLDGKIVVTGQGKSGIAAQKWVATFVSLGLDAVLLDTGGAFHGDIGIVKNGDALVVISKSGASDLLSNIISHAKRQGAICIGVFGSSDSPLQSLVDMSISLNIEDEIDTNNVIPSLSTMYQMAIGDLLAMSVMEIRGIKIEDFLQNHAGGHIGYYNSKTLLDIIDTSNKPQIMASDSITEVIINMTTHQKGATVVFDSQFELIGIITDGDLRRMLQVNSSPLNLSAADIMSQNPKTINVTSSPKAALDLMKSYKITQLVVMNDGEYCGMVHLHDLTNLLV